MINCFNDLRYELEIAENQIQVQLEAQQRQLKRIRDHINETETVLRNYVASPTLSH